MSQIQGQHLVIARNQTANAVLGPFRLQGDHIVALSGVLGGATVSFSHKMPVDNNAETLINLATDASMVFTTLPGPFPYKCSPALQMYVTITGATGSTSVNLTMFKVNP